MALVAGWESRSGWLGIGEPLPVWTFTRCGGSPSPGCATSTCETSAVPGSPTWSTKLLDTGPEARELWDGYTSDFPRRRHTVRLRHPPVASSSSAS